MIFLELFGGPGDHIQNSGSFREFLVGKQLSNLFDGQLVSVAEKPAPAFDCRRIIQRFCGDLKMIQLQKMDLQIVRQSQGMGFFTEPEVQMQLSRLAVQSSCQHTNTNSRLQ